jgi:ElaB/YqjD/DUF883 family membrane-anchored ribosome-binding protein
MDSAHTSNEKIAEALRLLEEAAKDKKDELRNLVTDKYTHLKDVLVSTEHSVADRLSAAQKRAMEAALRAKDVTYEKIKETATCVDDHVRENPWAYIAGVGAVAFLAGFILGRKK